MAQDLAALEAFSEVGAYCELSCVLCFVLSVFCFLLSACSLGTVLVQSLILGACAGTCTLTVAAQELHRSDYSFQDPAALPRHVVSPASLHVTWRQGARGRPAAHIPAGALAYLLDEGYKKTEIADLYGVSVRTVDRLMDAAGLHRFSDISDESLRAKIVTIKSAEGSAWGARMVSPHLPLTHACV